MGSCKGGCQSQKKTQETPYIHVCHAKVTLVTEAGVVSFRSISFLLLLFRFCSVMSFGFVLFAFVSFRFWWPTWNWSWADSVILVFEFDSNCEALEGPGPRPGPRRLNGIQMLCFGTVFHLSYDCSVDWTIDGWNDRLINQTIDRLNNRSVKLTLERRFGRPNGAKLTPERRFRCPQRF